MARAPKDHWVEPLPSGRFRGRFLTAQGRKPGQTFDYQWEAEDWAAQQARRVREIAGEPAPGSRNTSGGGGSSVLLLPAVGDEPTPTLKAYAEDYVARRAGLLVKATVQGYKNAVAKFSDPKFAAAGSKAMGRRRMDEIEVADVERWITAQLTQGEGRPSINYRLTLLRSIYTAARRWGDPTQGIRQLAENVDDSVFLDEPQRDALLAACVDPGSERRLHRNRSRAGIRELATWAGVSTGSVSAVLAQDRANGGPGHRARKPVSARMVDRVHAAIDALGYEPDANLGPDVELEAMVLVGLDCGLRWEEVAALVPTAVRDGFITVRQVVERGQTVRGYPKGRKARSVPATARVLAALEPLIAAARQHGASHLLFCEPGGRALDYSNWRRSRFEPAVTRAGLDPRPTFHDTRHTYATRLAEAGVPTHVIAELLGHADDRLVQRYVHASTDGKRRALVLEAFDEEAA